MTFTSRDSDMGNQPPTPHPGSGYLLPPVLKHWDTFCVGLVLGSFLVVKLSLIILPLLVSMGAL